MESGSSWFKESLLENAPQNNPTDDVSGLPAPAMTERRSQTPSPSRHQAVPQNVMQLGLNCQVLSHSPKCKNTARNHSYLIMSCLL